MNAAPGPVGRFAPSPTGPLHFGSLVAALGSWASARAAGGTWYLRIDDLDQARAQAGATDTIRRQLDLLGLHHDGPVLFQRTRLDAYHTTLERLAEAGAVYPCSCTRREIEATSAGRGPLGAIYPGTCRREGPRDDGSRALRLPLDGDDLALQDRIQGVYRVAAAAIGDVAVRRREGQPAYHLATTLDDVHLGVTHVVRGADLLPAALIQSRLASVLDLPEPTWSHLPVALAPDGAKLSKQTGATPIDTTDPVAALLRAWAFLGQPAPPDRPANPAEFLAWARRYWEEASVPATAKTAGTTDEHR